MRQGVKASLINRKVGLLKIIFHRHPQTPKRGVSSESDVYKSNVHDYFEFKHKRYRLVTTIQSTFCRANLFKELK